MRCIQLTRGHVATVDDEDFERINARKWFAVVGRYQVRAARQSMRKNIYMHYEVLEIEVVPGFEIDHIDRDPLNNCKENLRVVTHGQNMLNTFSHENQVGYCYNKRVNLWSCYLDRPGLSRKYLGYTKTKEEAIARVEAARGSDLSYRN